MTKRVFGWGPAAVWAAVLFSLSAWEDPGVEWLAVPDKLAHATIYAVLGVTLAWARLKSHPRVGHLLFLGLGWLFGLSDEWHQSFVVGRDAAVGDWVSDVVGVAIGYGAFWLAYRRISDEA